MRLAPPIPRCRSPCCSRLRRRQRPRRGDPDHIDTPADLKGADITRTLALAHLTSTARAQSGPLRADDVVRHAPDRRRHRLLRLPRDAAPDQGRLRLRRRRAGPVGAVERRSAGQRLEHRAVPGRADGRHRAPCASTWAPNAGRSTSTSRRWRCPARAPTTATTRRTSTAWQPTWTPRVGPVAGPRDVFVLADKLTDDPVWGIAQVIDDDRAGPENDSNDGRVDRDHVDQPVDRSPIRRIGGSRR